MTQTAAHLIRRILVALDASPSSRAALRAAADLAAAMEAELSGVAVEDIELLRIGEAPLAQEILYHSAEQSPMSRDLMERRLKAQSEHARALLEKEANRVHVSWSFRSVKGNVVPEVLAAAGDVDLVAMGKVGWSFGGRHRVGSAAQELALSPIPVLLLGETGLSRHAQWVTQFDGSAASKGALNLTAQLAAATSGRIMILLPMLSPEKSRVMRKDAEELLSGQDLGIRFREIDLGDETSLFRALDAGAVDTVVVTSAEALRKYPPLKSLLSQAEISFLVLGNGAEPSAQLPASRLAEN
ncbi:MAG TPA: universal stress protein [Candidatus Sulfotelmatobacter sp.]|nr:universal stress protein [Candidatus Sulfotelmatobacter sp.]